MSTDKTHYQILGIDPQASDDEIRKAYEKLACVYPPDLNPKSPRTSEDTFKQLQEAYSVLSDSNSRYQYDQAVGFAPARQPPLEDQCPPSHSAPGEYVRPKYKVNEWTVYFQGEKEKTRWLDRLGWRRKLALVFCVLCLLGAFVPATYWVHVSRTRVSASVAPSFRLRLLYATIPLIMIWIGTRMSDQDGLETSIGTVGNETFGYLLEALGWVSFAYLMRATLLGFLTYLYS